MALQNLTKISLAIVLLASLFLKIIEGVVNGLFRKFLYTAVKLNHYRLPSEVLDCVIKY